MDDLISLYIDNELSLEEKIHFVERVHEDTDYKATSVALLEQEKLIRSRVVERFPDAYPIARKRRFLSSLWRPVAVAVPSAAVAAFLVILFFLPGRTLSTPFRFVVYQPQATDVVIAGTFTDWRRIPLKRVGGGGYWELTLELPRGEHRFSYIVDGATQVADPSLPAREKDDFGGVNSILSIGA
jgi:hypothetical protein